MRVKLKGINRVVKRLAGGRTVTYYYAWKGGPRLKGEPGKPEFMASYNEAVAQKLTVPAGTIARIVRSYEASDDFKGLAERTRDDYVEKLKLIEREFGDFPLAALEARKVRGVFLGWRDQLPGKSRRQADYAITVLARVFSWSLDRGLITNNPLQKPGRRYRGSRREQVWSFEDEAAFLERAPAHMHLPLLLALWTGQRQGDLLCLPWSGYDGSRIRLRQSKTGARVAVPVGAPLKAALDRTPKRSTVILTNLDGKAWTANGFRSSWAKACKRAGVAGLTFHDLRGTAVTRLALAGATELEIAVVTGLTLATVTEILEKHYLHRDPRIAENAIAKLERRIRAGTDSPN